MNRDENKRIFIKGVGTATPSYTYNQSSVREIVSELFSGRVENLDRILKVFDNLHIRKRHFSRPAAWYGQEHGLKETNDLFIESAGALGKKAAIRAMEHAQVNASDISGVVVATTTGMMTPSLDAVLVEALNIPMNAVRLPIFGLGCAGGAGGVARSADLSFAHHGALVLFVAVEICSATFKKNDLSKANLVGTSIFADGAAALVIGTDTSGVEVVNSYHQLFPDTGDIMGWDFIDTGMKVRFSRDIPAFVRKNLPQVLNSACRKWGIDIDDITTFITHPGGAKVLTAYAEALNKNADLFDSAYRMLENFGNMSSASILFVYEHMLKKNRIKPGYGLMSALGPGFSSDQVLLKVT